MIESKRLLALLFSDVTTATAAATPARAFSVYERKP
jgi:hypothetical protein